MRAETVHGLFALTYGFDTAVGFFLSVRKGRRRLVEYDGTRPGYDGLRGLVKALVDAKVVTVEDVAGAVLVLPHVRRLEDVPEPGVRLVVETTTALRRAAGDA